MRLAGKDNRPVSGTNRDCLVAVRVPRSWDDKNVRQDLRLAFHFMVEGTVEVNEAGQRVVCVAASLLQFARLDEDRTAGEGRVPAAVIEV